MKKTVIALFIILFSSQGLAGNAQMNVTLTRLINQINAMMPLIDEASREQDKNPRVKLHFDRFVDAEGVEHQGLRQDLLAIRDALIRHIDRPALEPKTIKPLEHDFVGGRHEF